MYTGPGVVDIAPACGRTSRQKRCKYPDWGGTGNTELPVFQSSTARHEPLLLRDLVGFNMCIAVMVKGPSNMFWTVPDIFF